jgi:hypothetical protein
MGRLGLIDEEPRRRSILGNNSQSLCHQLLKKRKGREKLEDNEQIIGVTYRRHGRSIKKVQYF